MRVLAWARLVCFGFVAGVICIVGEPALARTNHALIVAVTKYPNVANADLIGPNNDARLVFDYLTKSAPEPFSPGNIVVLADDFEGAVGSPTQAAILDELSALAERAEEGDLVYIHLSGHGSRQPAIDRQAEPDGRDEIFLPADVAPLDQTTGSVPNALPDDRIGRALTAIRGKGAFVWIVIDACNSGTATRGFGGPDVVYRKLHPSRLGITDDMFSDANQNPASEAGSDVAELARYDLAGTVEHSRGEVGAGETPPGGMVAFFAAQSIEETPELPLPPGAGKKHKLGLFTYTLFSQIAANPTQSYRQLGQSILSAYSALGRSGPTPLYEGDLDALVFGTDVSNVDRQWKVSQERTGLHISAGSLHRLALGAKFALLRSANDAESEALGYAEVSEAEILKSKLATISHAGKPRLAVKAVPDGAYARLVGITFDTELIVSRPSGSGRFETHVSDTTSLLDQIIGDPDTPVRIKLVEPDETADLRLAVMSEWEVARLASNRTAANQATRSPEGDAVGKGPRLWILPATGEISLVEGQRPPSIDIGEIEQARLRDQLSTVLTRAFRATNLARLATLGRLEMDGLRLQIKMGRRDVTQKEVVEDGIIPLARPRDSMFVEFSNESGRSIDVNILYIGSDYSIGHMYGDRIHNGDRIDRKILDFNDKSFGMERLVVVLTEGSALTDFEDLRFLEQDGVSRATRGPQTNFGGLLRAIGSAAATRGADKPSDTAYEGSVLVYPVRTQPHS